jgi:hypothetical protein
MGSLVVVAIPDENDRVWKVSSEKVPHLTLLYLGDDASVVPNVDQIISFVDHAAGLMLRRFYLPVDRRGELGADQADVLFFKKNRYDAKAIREFRSALLKDNNIKTAYDSTAQFDGPWQPHLTLGYPTAPAKPDKDDYPIYDVNFNRIAVWTGDSTGPEFLLKDYWDEVDDALESVPMDVAMSDIQHAAKVSDAKWSDFSQGDYTDAQWATACLLDRGSDIDGKQRYGLPVREPDGTVNRNACHAAAAVLSSTGGTGAARGNKVSASAVQLESAKKKLVTLYTGTLNEDVPEGLGGEVKQTVDLGAEFLAHYGVKGMRWGTRRGESPSAVTPTATSVVPSGRFRKTKVKAEGGENQPAHEDAIKVARVQATLKKSGPAALSNQELQELQTRLNLERNVTQLVSSTSRVNKGRNFVRGFTNANQEVNNTVNTGLQTQRLVGQVRGPATA